MRARLTFSRNDAGTRKNTPIKLRIFTGRGCGDGGKNPTDRVWAYIKE